MNIFNKERKVKPWLLALVFILIVALLIFILISAKLERNNLNEGELSSLEANNSEINFWENQDNLALLYEREVYLSDNLSSLSPEKEVLGGSFYLTNVYWDDQNSALIEYEDGHIAVKARVVFAEGLELESFEIIPEELN